MKKKEIIFGLMIALVFAAFLSLFASSSPDGLERVAEDLGFIEKGEVAPTVASPVPDYAFPGVRNELLSTSLAGIAGTLLVFGAGYGLAALLKRKA